VSNRIIKESICTIDTIEHLTWFEEVFFYRLLVNCDDYGRFDARPSIIKARLFPLKNFNDKTINDALKSLSEAKLILMYNKDGKPYIQVTTWESHQNIRNKRSKYPSFEERDLPIEYNCNQMNSIENNCFSNPIQSNPNTNPNPIQSNTDIVINPKTDNNKYPSISEQINSFTEDGELRTLLNQFVDMRIKIKKKPTEYAFSLLLRKLIKLSSDTTVQKNIISQSLVNNWQDIYELKKNFQCTNGGPKKEASLPDWYDNYQKELEGLPKKEKEMSKEEINKILLDADKEFNGVNP
jgi:hypothetical protein